MSKILPQFDDSKIPNDDKNLLKFMGVTTAIFGNKKLLDKLKENNIQDPVKMLEYMSTSDLVDPEDIVKFNEAASTLSTVPKTKALEYLNAVSMSVPNDQKHYYDKIKKSLSETVINKRDEQPMNLKDLDVKVNQGKKKSKKKRNVKK